MCSKLEPLEHLQFTRRTDRSMDYRFNSAFSSVRCETIAEVVSLQHPMLEVEKVVSHENVYLNRSFPIRKFYINHFGRFKGDAILGLVIIGSSFS